MGSSGEGSLDPYKEFVHFCHTICRSSFLTLDIVVILRAIDDAVATRLQPDVAMCQIRSTFGSLSILRNVERLDIRIAAPADMPK